MSNSFSQFFSSDGGVVPSQYCERWQLWLYWVFWCWTSWGLLSSSTSPTWTTRVVRPWPPCTEQNGGKKVKAFYPWMRWLSWNGKNCAKWSNLTIVFWKLLHTHTFFTSLLLLLLFFNGRYVSGHPDFWSDKALITVLRFISHIHRMCGTITLQFRILFLLLVSFLYLSLMLVCRW